MSYPFLLSLGCPLTSLPYPQALLIVLSNITHAGLHVLGGGVKILVEDGVGDKFGLCGDDKSWGHFQMSNIGLQPTQNLLESGFRSWHIYFFRGALWE